MAEQRENVTHLRINPRTWARLKREAADRDVSVNWLAGRLLEDGLGRLLPAAEFRLTRPPEERV